MLNILSAKNSKDLGRLLFEKIAAELECGKQVVCVVPAQASLSMEKNAFSMLEKDGFFDLRILRGQKFAEEILSKTEKPGKVAIDSIGRSMLLRTIAGDFQEQLGTFKSVAKDPEFIELATDFITQLKQNTVDEAALDSIIKNSNSILSGKLSDMKVLSSEYQKLMEGKFTDSEDLVLFTANMAQSAPIVKESAIFYYGFYSFTNREITLLRALEQGSRGLNIALLLGDAPQFAVTKDTLKKLQASFGNVNISSANGSDAYINAPKENLRLVCCANPYSQALSIASDIKAKIREGKLLYSDIAVLTGKSPEMLGTIKRVFKEFEIPFFADEKKSILHSSAIESLISALDAINSDYQRKDVIRFIKSGGLSISDSDLESFENYTKAYHIKKERFAKPFKYGKEALGEDSFNKLEELRHGVFETLSKLQMDLDNACTVKDKATALYLFLRDEIKLPEMLKELSKKQEEAGFLDASEESLQVWDNLCDLLDQMVELIGDRTLSSFEFAKILKDALADIKVGVLPQSEGKILLGEFSHAQLEDIKAIYIAGFNDDLIPSKNDPNGILTPSELMSIKELGITLSKDSDTLAGEELFCLYKLLSSATDYLWLGYSMTSSSGEDLKISPLLSELAKKYNLKEEKDIFNQESELAFIEGKKMATQRLAEVLRSGISGESIPSLWKQTYNLLKEDSDLIKSGLKYTNKKQNLEKELVQKLYTKGPSYTLSPSRMDKFASCPFKYFVSYGLKPKEETDFGMNAGEIGTIHHEALLKLCEKLSTTSKEGGFAITDPRSLWMTVSNDEIEKMIDEILSDLQNQALGGVMQSSKENEYISARTKKTCTRFAIHMVEQVRHSVIDDMYFESDFGEGKSFPAIEVNTVSGKVYIEGRIDRIDIAKKDETPYIRVIDYKSGNTKFNKGLIERGLSLQLMVYLSSASKNYTQSPKEGIYYFHIKDVPIASSLEDFPKEELAEEVLEKISKEYKLDGMDIDNDFKEKFANNLKQLCEKLTAGYINPEPKKIKTIYDSCVYCAYSSICQKGI